jgi:hypothetical protein
MFCAVCAGIAPVRARLKNTKMSKRKAPPLHKRNITDLEALEIEEFQQRHATKCLADALDRQHAAIAALGKPLADSVATRIVKRMPRILKWIEEDFLAGGNGDGTAYSHWFDSVFGLNTSVQDWLLVMRCFEPTEKIIDALLAYQAAGERYDQYENEEEAEHLNSCAIALREALSTAACLKRHASTMATARDKRSVAEWQQYAAKIANEVLNCAVEEYVVSSRLPTFYCNNVVEIAANRGVRLTYYTDNDTRAAFLRLTK